MMAPVRRGLTTGLLVISVACPAPAQDRPETVRSLGEHTTIIRNPAAMPYDSTAETAVITLRTDITSGLLHGPQEALRAGRWVASARGEGSLDSWHFTGGVAFARETEDGVHWRSGRRAVSGSPYQWADTSGGTWRHASISLEAGVCTPPLMGGATGGVTVRYDAGDGSRQNDPRPLYRSRTILLSPALVVPLGPGRRVSARIDIGWDKEEDEFGYYANDYSQLIRLRALGASDISTVNSAERNVHQRLLGADLQYREAWPAGSIEGSCYTWQTADSALEGIARPELRGRYVARGIDARAVLRLQLEPGWLTLELAYTTLHGRGEDPVYKAGDYASVVEHGSVRAGFDRPDDPSRSGPAGGVRMEMMRTSRSALSMLTAWHSHQLLCGVDATWTERLSPSSTLVVGVDVRFPLAVRAARSSAGRPRITSILAEEEYRYLAAGILVLTPVCGFETRLPGATPLRLRASLRGGWAMSSGASVDGMHETRTAHEVMIQVLY